MAGSVASHHNTKEETVPVTRPAPLCQIRVIAATDDATALLTRITEQARHLLGPDITCRTQTRSARRIGHVRAYVTISRKEEH
jgi:hypothetical protein